MPSRPGRPGRTSAADAHADNGTDDGADNAHADTGAERQEQTAGELSDRAADSIDRRYDATKEVHLGDRAHERPAGGLPETAADESAADSDGAPAEADDRTATE